MNYRKAKMSEMNACTEIVKEAFHDYEFFQIYVDNLEKRNVFFNTMMEIWMKNSFKYGTVLVGTEDEKIISVAVLKAPADKEIDFTDYSISTLKMKLAGGRKATKAFLNMCEVSDAACHALPSPKWHLVLLAVSGKCKGKGIGSSMLNKCILPYISQHGGGLFTFNTNAEINRSFYKKNGFDEFDEFVLHENGHELGNWSYKMMVD